jgi:hypothetical protein
VSPWTDDRVDEWGDDACPSPVAETIDPDDAAYYFGAPPIPPEDLVPPVRQTRRRFGMFRQ